MSSTNKTANYKLSQFIGTDKPTFLGDYNNDMEIIDSELFSASQTAKQAVNDVESVKGAQAELKNVHVETQKQVAQLKETADGMSGDVTAAQESANRAEQKATEAQTAATGVVNAANTASANATKAKQTADGNKTTISNLEERVNALESKPSKEDFTISLYLNTLPKTGSGIATSAPPTKINKPAGYIFKRVVINAIKTVNTVFGDNANIGTTPFDSNKVSNYNTISIAPAAFNPQYPSDVAVNATITFSPES